MGSKINEISNINKFIYSRLDQEIITRDAVDVYHKLFDEEVSKLYSNETGNNKDSVNKLLSQIREAKRQVALTSLEQLSKDKISNELDALELFVNSNPIDLNTTIINNTNDESAYDLISGFVSSITSKTAQYFKSDSEVLELAKNLISNLKSKTNEFKPLFTAKLNEILNKAQKYIDNKKYDDIQNVYSNLIGDINSITIANKLYISVSSLLENSHLDKKDQSLIQADINKLQYNDFFTFVPLLNEQIAKINSIKTIHEFLKNNLQILKSQIDYSIAHAAEFSTSPDLKPIQDVLTQLASFNTDSSPNAELASHFEEMLNFERVHNKKELANLLTQLQAEFAKGMVSPDLVNLWDSVKNKFIEYANNYSTSTREEMASYISNDGLISKNGAAQNAFKILQDAKLSNRVNSIKNQTDETLRLIEIEFGDDDNTVKDELKRKVKEIAAKAKLIQQDDSLSDDTKHSLLEKLEAEHQIYRNKIAEIKSLGAEKDAADNIIESVKDNDQVKIYLAKELKIIKDLRQKAIDALNNPTDPNVNLSEIQSQLNAALKDFGDKRNELEGRTAAAAINKLLNDVFSIYREPGESETPAESKLAKALAKLQAQTEAIGKSTDKNELQKKNERQKVVNEMVVLRDAIEAVSTLEVGTKNLESDHKRALIVTADLRKEADGNLFGDDVAANTEFKNAVEHLESENAKTQQKIDELKDIINNQLYDVMIHNKAWLDQKNREISNLRKQIEINVSLAKLKKEQLQLSSNQIKPTELTDSSDISKEPFDLLVNDVKLFERLKDKSVETVNSKNAEINELNSQINTKREELEQLWKDGINLVDQDAIKENEAKISALESEVKGLQSRVQDAYVEAEISASSTAVKLAQKQPLLAKLKKAALIYDKIDKQKYPELASNLLEVIKQNRAGLDDSNGTINTKISRIDSMLQKIESSKEAKDEIVKLQNLQSNQFKGDDKVQRVIFNDLDAKIAEIIAEQQSVLSDVNSTNAQLIQAKNIMKIALINYTNRKSDLNKQFESAKDDLAESLKEFEQQEKDSHFTTYNTNEPQNGSYVQKLKLEYENLINKTPDAEGEQSNFDKATLDDFKNIKDKIELAFNKDKFNDKKAKLEAKINDLKEKLAQDPALTLNGVDPIDKIEKLVAKLNENINDDTADNSVSDVIVQTAKLESLEALLDEQAKVAKKIKTLPENDPNKSFLTQAYQESSPLAENEEPSVSSPTSYEIDAKRVQLEQKYAEASSFDELKDEEKAEIASVKEQFANGMNGVDADASAKTAVDNLLDKYVQDLDNVQRSDEEHKGDDKKQIAEIADKVRQVKANIANIVEFAKFVKKSEQATTDIDATTGELSAGVAEFKRKLEEKIVEAKSKYTDFSAFSTLKEEIDTLIRREGEYAKLNTDITALKAKVETITYKLGTGATTDPTTKKEQFKQFVAKLIEYGASSQIKDDSIKISLLNTIVSNTDSLIDIQSEKLNHYEKTPWTYDNVQYGYESDEKNIGQAVLDSVPDVPTGEFNSTELSNGINLLKQNLNSEYEAADNLYKARVIALNKIKELLVVEQGQINQIQNPGNKYDELTEDQNIFFKEQLTKVKNVVLPANISQIETIEQDTIKAHDLLSLYIELANTVADAKAKVAQVNQTSANKAQELTDVIHDITEKYEEIDKDSATQTADNYYFNQLNRADIEQKNETLTSLIAKVDLLVKYNEKVNELEGETLDSDSTVNNKLKAPLKAILASLISDLANYTTINIDTIDTLTNKYLSGGANSFDTALANTKKLNAAIAKAKSFDGKSDNDYYNIETSEMKALYDDLQTILANANTNIRQTFDYPTPHDEANKLQSIYNIENDIDGIIARIKAEKDKEVKQALYEIKVIDDYLSETYTGSQSPEQRAFKDLAIRNNANDSVETLANIKSVNEIYIAANTEIAKQKEAIINYEKNRLKVMYERLKPYVNFLSGENYTSGSTTGVLTPEQSSKISKYLGLNLFINGIKDDLNRYTQVHDSTTNDSNFILRTKELRSLYNVLENDYSTIKTISQKSIINLKSEINNFNEQLKEDTTDHSHLYELIKKIADKNGSFPTIQIHISEVNSANSTITSDFNSLGVKTYESIDYNQDTDSNTQSDIEREFATYEESSKGILNAINKIDLLIYGTSENDVDGLQGNYNKFIEKRTMNEMLKLVAGEDYRENAQTNIPFADIILTYASIYNSLTDANQSSANTELAKKNDLSINQKLSALFSVYKPSVSLLEWMEQETNKQFFFNYLLGNDEAKIRKEILPNSDVLLETVIEKVRAADPNNDKLELEVTQINEFMDQFDKFIFLKDVSAHDNNYKLYNTNNVKVFITRTNTTDEWVPTILQSDTSIKKTKFNIKVKYVRPTSGEEANNFFNDVTDFEIKFNDVWVTFNTLKALRISKHDIYKNDSATVAESRSYSSSKVLFEASKAGWNNKTFNTVLLGRLLKGGQQYQSRNNLPFYREDVSFDDAQWDNAIKNEIQKPANVNSLSLKQILDGNYDSNTDLSTSGPNLKFKIKFKESVAGLLAEINSGSNDHWNIPKIGNKQFMYWIQSSSDLVLRGTDYTSYIPFFVSIPVVSDTGKYAVLYIFYETSTTVDFNSNVDFGYAYNNIPDAFANWSIYLPLESTDNNSFNSLTESAINSSPDVQGVTDTEALNAIKANVFAQNFLTRFNDKRAQARDNYRGRRIGQFNYYGPELNNVIDKFDIYLTLHDKKEEGRN
ncbi:hypothetical protein NXS15_00180 [Mycoplasma sp. CSL7475-4]|uniref:hypothetical protein n=1 Tax=Mycoplasma sp. CSL7475-4 TaxID=2973942 RepID=UPI00216ADFB9|nr:hypothetical protein [Mycoplasma sp. CSL7475-4]MCS4536550.1 hypothetical protein [Mycoplasma sp. CSL7475-4]